MVATQFRCRTGFDGGFGGRQLRRQVVRELLAESLRSYRLRKSLQAAHAALGPAARQSGWLTEDDVLQDVP